MSEISALHGGDSPEYIPALLAYLGEGDPMEVFAQTDAALRKATAGISDSRLRAPEKPGKWSVIEVVQHLADAEFALAVRYRAALAEPGGPVIGFDQDKWCEALNYAEADLNDALEQFQALRRLNLRLLRNTSADQRRSAHIQHNQRGKETLEDMMRLYAAHDLYHLHQIERIKKAIGADAD